MSDLNLQEYGALKATVQHTKYALARAEGLLEVERSAHQRARDECMDMRLQLKNLEMKMLETATEAKLLQYQLQQAQQHPQQQVAPRQGRQPTARVCKFFDSPRGCRSGTCTFQHAHHSSSRRSRSPPRRPPSRRSPPRSPSRRPPSRRSPRREAPPPPPTVAARSSSPAATMPAMPAARSPSQSRSSAATSPTSRSRRRSQSRSHAAKARAKAAAGARAAGAQRPLRQEGGVAGAASGPPLRARGQPEHDNDIDIVARPTFPHLTQRLDSRYKYYIIYIK